MRCSNQFHRLQPTGLVDRNNGWVTAVFFLRLVVVIALRPWMTCQAAESVGTSAGDSQHLERVPIPAKRESRSDSLEWLVGRWEWVAKTRTGSVPEALQSLSELAVFPFVNYEGLPGTNGMPITAEFRVLESSGARRLLGKYPSVTAYGTRVLVYGAGPTTFSFQYTFGLAGTTRSWIELKWVDGLTNQFAIRFEKVDVDPGSPIDWSFASQFILTPNMEVYNDAYRKKLGLEPRKALDSADQ